MVVYLSDFNSNISFRELNPMFEGHFQHDAQELLRCLLCYIEDAEKELHKLKLKETEKIKDGQEKAVENVNLINCDEKSADNTLAPEPLVKASLQQNDNTLKGGDPLSCSKGKPVKRGRGRPRKAVSSVEVAQQHELKTSTSVSAYETNCVGDSEQEPMVSVNSKGCKRRLSNSSLHKVMEKDPQQSSISTFLTTPTAGGCVDNTLDMSKTNISVNKKKSCVDGKKTTEKGGARLLFRKLQQKLSLGSNSESSMSGILSMFPLQQIKRLGMRGRAVADPVKQESGLAGLGTAGHSKAVHGFSGSENSDDNNNKPVSKTTPFPPDSDFDVNCHGDNRPKYLTSTFLDKTSPRKNSSVASYDISTLSERDIHGTTSSYDLGTKNTLLSLSPSRMCSDHLLANFDEISILSDNDSPRTSSSYDLGMRKMHPSRSPSNLYPEIPPADANPTKSIIKKEVEITVHSPSKCKSPTRTRTGGSLEGSLEHSNTHQENTPVHTRVTNCGSRNCSRMSERNTPAPNSPAQLLHSPSFQNHPTHPNYLETQSPNSLRELEVKLKNCDCLGVSPVSSVSAKHALSVLRSDDCVPSFKTSTARRAIQWGGPESPDASCHQSELKQKPIPAEGIQLNEQTPRVSTRRSPSTSPGSAARVYHMTRTPSNSPSVPRTNSPRTPDVSHLTQGVSLRPLSIALDNCDWLLSARGQTVSANKVLLSMKKNKNSKLQFNVNQKLSTGQTHNIFNLITSGTFFFSPFSLICFASVKQRYLKYLYTK